VWHAAGERRVSFGVAWSVAAGGLLLTLG
jgi:hypothetical protein